MSIRIYLLAETVLTGGAEQFLADRNLQWRQDDRPSDAEQLIELAGRICYMSFAERQYRSRNDLYIGNLIQQGHESVLEHASFSLLVDGISRGLSHQLVRHRIGFSYSELSQQYCDKTPLRWAIPPELDRHSEARDEWDRLIAYAERAYKSILARMHESPAGDHLSTKEANRLARSVARSVLPSAASTTLVITGNARAWRYLMKIRGAIPGDLEMREYCVKVLELLAPRANNLFADFEIAHDSLGPMVKTRTIANESSERS